MERHLTGREEGAPTYENGLENILMLQKLKNKDKQAFCNFYDIYKEKVYKAALMITKDKFYAEYVMEETFLRAYYSIQNFKNVNDFNDWLNEKIIICSCRLMGQDSMESSNFAEDKFDFEADDNDLSEESYNEQLRFIEEKIKRNKYNILLRYGDTAVNFIRDINLHKFVRSLAIISILIFSMTLLTSGSKNPFIELKNLPENYTREAAAKNGDVVYGDIFKICNENKLIDFLEKVKKKIPCSVRIAMFTLESEDVTIEDIIYNGKVIRMVLDDSRCRQGSRDFIEYIGQELIEVPSPGFSLNYYMIDQTYSRRTVIRIPEYYSYDNISFPQNIAASARSGIRYFQINVVSGTYSWINSNKKWVTIKREPVEKLVEDSNFDEVSPGAEVSLGFVKSPSKIEVSLFDGIGDSFKLVSTEGSFKIPEKEGEYIYSIKCCWEDRGSSDYAIKLKAKI